MTTVHGFFIVLAGGFVAFLSNYLNEQRGTTDLAIFFYVGLAFAAFGLLKWFFVDARKRGKKVLRKKQHAHHHKQINNPSPQGSYCHGCGAAIHQGSNFCSQCGARL